MQIAECLPNSRVFGMVIPVLAYWNIRGMAQPIRFLLAYTKTEFEDKHYVVSPPDFDRSSWFDVKFTLGLDFPNLPYYIDGDVKLTQSYAIMRYIGRKHNLLGTNEQEMTRVDLMINQLDDFRHGWVTLCFSDDFETLKGNYINELPQKLAQYSNYLSGYKWVAGDNITIADFVLYEYLDQHLMLVPDCLDSFPNLISYLARFRSLETIRTYLQNTSLCWDAVTLGKLVRESGH